MGFRGKGSGFMGCSFFLGLGFMGFRVVWMAYYLSLLFSWDL